MNDKFYTYCRLWKNAIRCNNIRSVEALLEACPDVLNIDITRGENALMHTISEGFYDIFILLLNQPNINLLYELIGSKYTFIEIARIRNYGVLTNYHVQKIILTKEPSLIKNLKQFYNLHPLIEIEFAYLNVYELGML